MRCFSVRSGVRLTDPGRVFLHGYGPSAELTIRRLITPWAQTLTVSAPDNRDPGLLPALPRLIHARALALVRSICPNLQQLTLVNGSVLLSVFECLPASVRNVTLQAVCVTGITALRAMIYQFDVTVERRLDVVVAPAAEGAVGQVLSALDQFIPRLSVDETDNLAQKIAQIGNVSTRARVGMIVRQYVQSLRRLQRSSSDNHSGILAALTRDPRHLRRPELLHTSYSRSLG